MTTAIQYFNDKSQHVCRVLALWSRKTFKESNVVEDMVGEVWKQIRGHDQYEVSNFGRVRSCASGKLRLLSPDCSGGYRRVTISYSGKKSGKRASVHTLVLEAFCGPRPSSEHEGAHNNGIKHDNRIDNLRWATPKENCADRVIHGTLRCGERHGRSKLSNKQTMEIYSLRNSGLLQQQIADMFGVDQTTISKIFLGVSRSMVTRCEVPA